MSKVSLRSALALAAGLFLSAGAPALASVSGDIIYGLANYAAGPHLVSFHSTSPNTFDSNVTISGITAGQTLVGMDFRPATGELIALGYDQASGGTIRLYVINPPTGVATAIGAGTTALNLGAESAANIGLDFNPTVDRIRVVTADGNLNLRLNPADGSVAGSDTNLAYAVGDANVARNPNIGAVAYTNSYLGATSTSLYDAELVPVAGGVNVILSNQNPPNNGTLNTTGSGTQPSQLLDLDFDVYNNLTTGVQTGYTVATYTVVPGSLYINHLGTIDFSNSAITDAGDVGAPTNTPVSYSIVDVAAFTNRPAILPAVTGNIAWALQTTANSFVTFDTNNPTLIRSVRAITGITETTIAGFDTRPLTGELFALGYTPGTESARLYIVAPGTGVATAVGASAFTLTGAGSSPLGFDFNPTVDRIRIVTTTGHNFRLDPNTGTIAATDTDLGYAVGDLRAGNSTNIGTAAYTNSVAGATSTTLYTIDENFQQLNTQAPPNNGTQHTVGSLGIALNGADPSVDLDILTVGATTTAFLTANLSGSTSDNLYTVNLATGAASLVGRIGGGIAIRDLALRLPVAKTWTGAADTDWSNSANWNPAGAPTSTDNILIPSAPTNQPTLSGSGAANLVLINAGATLTLGPASLMAFSNNVTNNGTIAGSATSNTLFNSATVQVLAGSGSTTLGIVQLSISSAGLSLDAASAGLSVLRLLNLSGNLTTNGRPLTLVSDASGTAMVVNSGGVVTGNATVQRFLKTTSPGTTAVGYHTLSSPVTNSTVADLATATFTPVANTAFNFLTTPGPGNPTPYPNVFGYNEARFPSNSSTFSQGYFAPNGSSQFATDAPLVPGRGYSIYMSGTNKPDFVGTLNTGTVSPGPLTRTGNNPKSGWHLLGNPYPSPIDWDLVTVPAGMDPAIYTVRTTGGLGVVYTTLTNGVGAPGTDLIGVAQAFFAHVTATVPGFSFTNAARLTSYANPTVYRTAPDTRPMVALSLRRTEQPATAADAAYVYFQDGASAAVERNLDAVKLRSEGDAASLFTLVGGQELAINGLAATALDAATVPLGIVLPTAGTYVLSATELRNLAPGAVTLLDRRTGTSYDLATQSVVTFSAARSGADLTRFELRFGRGAGTAAVSTLSLDVYPNPAHGALHLTALGIGQGATAEVTLADALGRVVIRQTVAVLGEAASTTLPTNGLRPGTYTLRLTTANGAPTTRQVVVE